MRPRNRTFPVLAVLSAAIVFSPPAEAQFVQQGSKLAGSGVAGTAGANQGDGSALSGDGTTLAVGGSSDNNFQGAVWVYTRSNSAWSPQGNKLVGSGAVGSGPSQGFSVALSADGNTLIDGAPNDGAD